MPGLTKIRYSMTSPNRHWVGILCEHTRPEAFLKVSLSVSSSRSFRAMN